MRFLPIVFYLFMIAVISIGQKRINSADNNEINIEQTTVSSETNTLDSDSLGLVHLKTAYLIDNYIDSYIVNF